MTLQSRNNFLMDLFQIYTNLLTFEPITINLPDISGEDIDDI